MEELFLDLSHNNLKSFSVKLPFINDINQLSTGLFPGQTLLHVICKKGNFDFLKSILNYQSLDLNKRNVGRQSTGLHLAVENNQDSLIIELISNSKCDINVEDGIGYTAFHYACTLNKVKIITLFLQKFYRTIRITQHDIWYLFFNKSLISIINLVAYYHRLQPLLTSFDIQNNNYNEAINFLADYKKDPKNFRLSCQIKVCHPYVVGCQLYLLGYGIQNNLYQIGSKADQSTRRFFRIFQLVPLDIQQILSLRSAGSTKEVIPRTDLIRIMSYFKDN